ncbi:Formylglycine-generating enzyme [Parvicella tangerina]|uniref:Formylglycine-generating enzyme n=2 Tax=Parvicella tangerina TaxID=2829795 RepID=A0A916JS14_9FLAO|nr:Formylglycine-generating enzyme [Parvicella tangerina]
MLLLCLFSLSQSNLAQRGKKGELVGVLTSLELPDFQSKKVPKDIRPYVENMIYIPAGVFNMGDDLDTNARFYSKRVSTVASFFLSKTEIPNWLYREFCQVMIDSLGMDSAHLFLPDTLCWLENESPYTEPMASYYFSHPAYDNYPVVGVNYLQTVLFCDWLTDKVQKGLSKDSKTKGWAKMISFRLPNESEWEYAARGGLDISAYPWGESYYVYNDGGYTPKANCGAIIDTLGHIVLPADHDGYRYTSDISSFSPNGYGLYNMSGNVAEWTLDIYNPYASIFDYDLNPTFYRDTLSPKDSVSRVVKGGSFEDLPYFLSCGVRKGIMAYTQSKSIGFSVAITIFQYASQDL